MLSTAHVNGALMRTMNDAFVDKISMAGTEDERWQDRGCELVWLREKGQRMVDKWTEKDSLVYSKN